MIPYLFIEHSDKIKYQQLRDVIRASEESKLQVSQCLVVPLVLDYSDKQFLGQNGDRNKNESDKL